MPASSPEPIVSSTPMRAMPWSNRAWCRNGGSASPRPSPFRRGRASAMAVLVLQAAGAWLGGLFGPVGAAIGSAAGALAGYALDRALLTGTQSVDGPRLSGPRPFSAEEGASLPRVYGTVRVGGALIWATRFEEASTTTRQGGKGGGAKVTEYSYFANAAFALSEGPIAGVRRVWADGRELDLAA